MSLCPSCLKPTTSVTCTLPGALLLISDMTSLMIGSSLVVGLAGRFCLAKGEGGMRYGICAGGSPSSMTGVTRRLADFLRQRTDTMRV